MVVGDPPFGLDNYERFHSYYYGEQTHVGRYRVVSTHAGLIRIDTATGATWRIIDNKWAEIEEQLSGEEGEACL